MELCFVINLTKDGNWAITHPPIFATWYVIVVVVVFPFSLRCSPRTSAERIHSRGTGRRASVQAWYVSFATTFLYQVASTCHLQKS